MTRLERVFNYLYLKLFSLGRWLSKTNRRFVIIISGILLLGFSWKEIPRTSIAGHEWGIDFYNLYTYHHCAEFKNFPYYGVGEQCLDSRGMVYPPLMYWMYTWVREFSYEQCYGILILLIVGGVLLSVIGLPGEQAQSKDSYFWFFPLLLLQFPSAFAIERGNNDILVLFLWLGLIASWCRGHYYLAGIAAAVAVQAKVYPIIPVGFLGLTWAFLWLKKNIDSNELELRKKLTPFALSFVIGSLLLFLVTWEQSIFYWFKVLPLWAKQGHGRFVTVHSIHSIIPSVRIVGIIVALLLACSWIRAINRYLLKDPVLILVGLLGISTYFQGISNDYNLITAYPLFSLLFLRALGRNPERYIYAGLLPIGIFATLGYKWFWANSKIDIAGLHIAIQVLWLILVSNIYSRSTRVLPSEINRI